MHQSDDITKGQIATGCGLALFLIFLIVGFESYKIVPPGAVGIQATFGSVSDTTLQPGLSFINPLSGVTIMTTQIQKHEASYGGASKDMQAVHVKMIMNYKLDGTKAIDVYKTIGQEYENTIIDPAANEVLRAILAKHQASDILWHRSEIKTDVQTTLEKWLGKYGIHLSEIALSEIKFDPAYEHAIEQKQVQEQLAQQKVYELEQAQKQAEIRAAQAKGEGDAAIAKAKGEADALRLRGDAEAAYNQQVSKSLSPVLIQQQYLKTWDGKLPKIMTGDKSGTTLMFPVDEK